MCHARIVAQPCGESLRQYRHTLRAMDGAKMGNVEKWQTWGLVSAYKSMLTDVETCQDCRKVMWEQIKMWGITEQVLDRMYVPESWEITQSE